MWVGGRVCGGGGCQPGTCASGYTGALCSECSAGTAKHLRECVACSESRSRVVIFVEVASIVLVLGWLTARSLGEPATAGVSADVVNYFLLFFFCFSFLLFLFLFTQLNHEARCIDQIVTPVLLCQLTQHTRAQNGSKRP